MEYANDKDTRSRSMEEKSVKVEQNENDKSCINRKLDPGRNPTR